MDSGRLKTKRTLSRSFYKYLQPPQTGLKYFNLTLHRATISHTQFHGYSVYSRKVEQLNHMCDIRRTYECQEQNVLGHHLMVLSGHKKQSHSLSYYFLSKQPWPRMSTSGYPMDRALPWLYLLTQPALLEQHYWGMFFNKIKPAEHWANISESQ